MLVYDVHACVHIRAGAGRAVVMVGVLWPQAPGAVVAVIALVMSSRTVTRLPPDAQTHGWSGAALAPCADAQAPLSSHRIVEEPLQNEKENPLAVE
jgi:hypothetical protein